MNTFQRAAIGDVLAQRELRNLALDHHDAGLQHGLDDALNWGRMAASHGDHADVALYETILFSRLIRAQFVRDEQRRALLMAEALALLDRRIDAGDANALERLSVLSGSASADDLAMARSWIEGASEHPQHDDTGRNARGE